MTAKRRFISAAALAAMLVGAVLGYGYWQVVFNGYLNFSLHDLAGQTPHRAYGDVARADIVFRNAAGDAIGEALIEPPYQYIRWKHPRHEACHLAELTMPSTQESRAQWSECVGQRARWFKSVGDTAKSLDVRWEACALVNVPFAAKKDATDWLTWWVPLPHVGGQPATIFSARIMLDSRDCSGRMLAN